MFFFIVRLRLVGEYMFWFIVLVVLFVSIVMVCIVIIFGMFVMLMI